MNYPRLLITAGIMCIGTFLVNAQEFPEADIYEGTVTVDGVIDSAWEAALEHTLSVDIDGTLPEEPDFSGYWKSLWDADNLYFLLVTVDNVTVSYPGEQFWLFDVTEIFIDPDNSKGTTYDGVNDSQFAWFRAGEDQIEVSNPLGLTVPFTNQSLVSSDGTVILELAIPWSELGITPSAELVMGLDVYMKDNDSGFAERKNQISWSPSRDEAWRNASLLGTVTLKSGQPEVWLWGLPVLEDNWVDTGSWMGWLNITYDPWLWSLSLNKYVYVGDESGWAYIPR